MGIYKRADLESFQMIYDSVVKQFPPERPSTVQEMRDKGLERYGIDKAAKAGEQGVIRWLGRQLVIARKEHGLGS